MDVLADERKDRWSPELCGIWGYFWSRNRVVWGDNAGIFLRDWRKKESLRH